MLRDTEYRRKSSTVEMVTLAALLIQFLALVFALWHGHREVKSLDVRDAAIERIVEHVDEEIQVAAHPKRAPLGVPP